MNQRRRFQQNFKKTLKEMTIRNYTRAKTEKIFYLRIENRICYKKFEDCSVDSKDELTLIYFTQGIFQRQTDP